MFARCAGGDTRHTHAWQPMEIAMVPWPLCRQRQARLFYRGLPAACRLYVCHRPAQGHINFVTLLRSAQNMGSQPRDGDMQGGMVSTTVGVGTFSTQTRKTTLAVSALVLCAAAGHRSGPCCFPVFLLSATWPHNGQPRLCCSAHLENKLQRLSWIIPKTATIRYLAVASRMF